MSQVHKGKTLSAETKLKLSIARLGENNVIFGRTLSEETKPLMSITHIGDKSSVSKSPGPTLVAVESGSGFCLFLFNSNNYFS